MQKNIVIYCVKGHSEVKKTEECCLAIGNRVYHVVKDLQDGHFSGVAFFVGRLVLRQESICYNAGDQLYIQNPLQQL